MPDFIRHPCWRKSCVENGKSPRSAGGDPAGRLEQRQRNAEPARGRDPDEPPREGRYKCEFDVPEDKAQENFTDGDSRILKRSGGGFDASYNAQTAVANVDAGSSPA